MKKARLEKGITLIALIITIVILLVLAVVTIGTVKESKIIGHAESVASEYTIAQEKEKIALAYSEYQIKKALPNIEELELEIKEKDVTIEPIGKFGWKVSYSNTGNIYGINSKGEYDEAITRIIEASEATGVGVENFIVYEDKFAIKQNKENANTEGYTNIPEKYIFYNWATVNVNDIEKIEKRTITSQPENNLICDMSNRTLVYDLNGDGKLDQQDMRLTSYLDSSCSSADGINEVTKLVPEYTYDKNEKYAMLLGFEESEQVFITFRPVLFSENAKSYSYSRGIEGVYLDNIICDTTNLNFYFGKFLYYTYER